jgi:hypothetical protein
VGVLAMAEVAENCGAIDNTENVSVNHNKSEKEEGKDAVVDVKEDEQKNVVEEKKEQESGDVKKTSTFQTKWTFWFDKKNLTKKSPHEENFEETLVKLGSFSNIEEFWRFLFVLF